MLSDLKPTSYVLETNYIYTYYWRVFIARFWFSLHERIFYNQDVQLYTENRISNQTQTVGPDSRSQRSSDVPQHWNIYIYIHIYIESLIYIYISTLCMYICNFINKLICLQIQMYLLMGGYLYICIYIYISIQTYIHICLYI